MPDCQVVSFSAVLSYRIEESREVKIETVHIAF